MSNSIKFEYTNWKGVKSKRNIIPIKLIFESNQYHGDNKNIWLLMAFDIDKQDVRSFAVKDISFPIYTSKRWRTHPISVDSHHHYELCSLLEILNRLLDTNKYNIKKSISIFKAKY